MDSILVVAFVLAAVGAAALLTSRALDRGASSMAPGTGLFMLLIVLGCGEAIRLIGRSARSALVLATAASVALLVAATFGWWAAAALVAAALTVWLLVWLKRSREEYAAELRDRADKHAQHEAAARRGEPNADHLHRL